MIKNIYLDDCLSAFYQKMPELVKLTYSEFLNKTFNVNNYKVREQLKRDVFKYALRLSIDLFDNNLSIDEILDQDYIWGNNSCFSHLQVRAYLELLEFVSNLQADVDERWGVTKSGNRYLVFSKCYTDDIVNFKDFIQVVLSHFIKPNGDVNDSALGGKWKDRMTTFY